MLYYTLMLVSCQELFKKFYRKFLALLKKLRFYVIINALRLSRMTADFHNPKQKRIKQMKKMFKIKNIAVSLLTLAVLAGCGTKPADAETTADTSSVTESAEAAPKLEIADNAIDFAASLKLGWNLGNTLDATGASGIRAEISWGQPVTTKEMIQLVKDSGFTSIRIPVSWGRHTDTDFTIEAEWFDRVNEVVDYAVDCGLYVIINSHHDCEQQYYYPTEECYDNSEKYIKAIWSQIAERFKDYDERLVFEAMNEPRLKGTDKEWWFDENDAQGIESINCIVKLNQVFVDTVRAAGGKNETRYLMVPSNAASPANALNKAFTMPNDPQNRTMLSVHAYTPYNFAMNAGGYKVWKSGRDGEIKDFMDSLNEKFIKNGYAVVIGEFGATNKDNPEDRAAWAENYTTLAAGYGMPCFIWDNSGTNVGAENFGLLDRKNLTVYFPELLEAYLKGYSK